jgi:murein L,D-transpeptidase YcbB/YkuD
MTPSSTARRSAYKNPVPVHLTYLTAWVSAAGSVEFRPDIYGRDRVPLSMSSHAELYGD